MEIKNKTIYFKSNKEFYAKESTGIKKNTMRIIPDIEQKLFNENKDKLERIQISLKGGYYFTRKISDISIFEYAGIEIVIFSWR